MIDSHHGWNRSFKPLIIGFSLSVICTLLSYYFVTQRSLAPSSLAASVVLMGSITTFVQFIFSMHLGIESRPRWNLMLFMFMLLVSFLVIAGSMWIMYNLDYNMMPNS